MSGTPQDLLNLYGQLRNVILARRFAVGRYFRADLASTYNNLGTFPGTACSDQTLPNIEPSPYAPTAGSLLDLQPGNSTNQQGSERWKIALHERENPLIGTGQLLLCLAIENSLGNTESLTIIRQALSSIANLFRFSGNHFNGYFVRWDAVRSDCWTLDASGNPSYCCDFPYNSEGNYLYCVPFSDPRYNSGKRRYEPSMDELTGLMMGLFMVNKFVTDPVATAQAQAQLKTIGDYLAQYNYFLVRPCGSFAWRGGAGGLPAMAYPYGRVFQQAVGDSFAPRSSFEDSCVTAGVWDGIKAAVQFWGVIGIFLSIPFGFLIGPYIGLFTTLLSVYPLYQLGRAWGVYLRRAAFNSENDSQAGEFALGYLVSKLPVDTAFKLMMWALGTFTSAGSTYANLIPMLCSTALGDSDTTVSGAYLSWLPSRRGSSGDSNPDFENKNVGTAAKRPFASAVGVSLGAGVSEQVNLANQIQAMYQSIVDQPKWQSELPVADYGVNAQTPPPTHVVEFYELPLEYMCCFALWAQLVSTTQGPIDPSVAAIGVPVGPVDMSTLPMVTIPQEVIQSGAVPSSIVAIPNSEIPVNSNTPYSNPPTIPPDPTPPVPATTSLVAALYQTCATIPTSPITNSGTWILTPPPSPGPNYTLVVEENVDPSTEWNGLTHTYTVLSAPAFMIGIGLVNAGDILIEISVSTGWWCSYQGHYLGTWTAWWSPN